MVTCACKHPKDEKFKCGRAQRGHMWPCPCACHHGWCRDERLKIGHDVLREQGAWGTLVQCVEGMHRNNWILWDFDGKCLAIGSESWCRSKITNPA